MKTKLVAMAGGLACVFATTAMPIYAEELYRTISGSSVALGVDADGQSLGSLVQTVFIPLKKNGEKYNKQGPTNIARVISSPAGYLPECYSDEHGQGLLLTYDSVDSVTTQANGDLVFGELDPLPDPDDLTKISKLCIFATHYEGVIYTKITGGTGEFEGACGWQKSTTTSQTLGSTGFAYVNGTGVGEIFRSPNCP